jgi:hypothetical protein
MYALLVGGLVHAASVTVKPGDDLNTVTSSLQPGDVVTFSPGEYVTEGTLNWTGLGTAEQPIRFVASGSVILQNSAGGYVAQIYDSSFVEMSGLTFEGLGDVTYTTPSGLLIVNSTDVTVEDCVVRNVWGTALRIDGNTANLSIRHNELSGTGDGSGIYVGCGEGECWMQDSTIEYNLVHDVTGHGIYLAEATQASTLQHNVIFRAGGNGIELNSTTFGPQNIVKGNAIWQVEGDGINVEGAALIQNNLIFEIGNNGIYSHNDDNYDDGLYDLQITHNTIARTDEWAARLDDWFGRENLVFANNALANTTGYGLFWDDTLYDEDYGTGTGTGADTTNYISHNVVTGLIDGFDPLLRPDFVQEGGGVSDYVSVEDWNFYPTANSVLRDAADAAGEAYIPQDDFNGTARDGASPDAGAYEYDGDDNPGWVVQEAFKVYEPSEGRNGSAVSGGCCGAGGGNEDPKTAALVLPLALIGVLRRRRQR